jgi:bifunctional non-homologous end joining protein LigD
LVERPPEGADWCHEIKFDGYRLLVEISESDVRLWTRNGKNWTNKLAPIAHALHSKPRQTAWLDGELVALDASGRSNFQLLQNALRDDSENRPTLIYYAFDIIHLDGYDLRRVALVDRKRALAQYIKGFKNPDVIRLSEFSRGQGGAFFDKVRELGLEGVVSKRLSSPYTEGRGRDWLKSKCTKRQEFVILGYTDPSGARSHLGALLLGLREGESFRYVGRVGTGFDETTLRHLKGDLSKLERTEPKNVLGTAGHNTRGVHWVKPKRVAEVRFTAFTEDGLVRHAIFEGLREDKPAKQVVLETPPGHTASPASSVSQKRLDYPITHPDKILYPVQGVTKQQLLEYYDAVAERILPLIANRPLALVRCPSGVGKACFFQKHPTESAPDGLRFVRIRESTGKAPYVVVDNRQGLFALVQLGVLEIHTWGCTIDDIEHPNLLVFDLDPDPDLPFSLVVEGAQRLRRLFDDAKLESFPKTTGGKGLHVCVPIHPEFEWAVVKDFSRRIAEELARESPNRYIATQSKALRKGKIYIDYLRNARGATAVAPYSTRARELAPVAVPLEWDEVVPKLDPSKFTVLTLHHRLARQRTDPFARMVQLRQRLALP